MFIARFPEQSRVRVALRQRIMRRLAAARSRHMHRRAVHPTEGDHIGLYPVECCADRQIHLISALAQRHPARPSLRPHQPRTETEDRYQSQPWRYPELWKTAAARGRGR
jgi:hypothetical protein